jgi:hypothetical protein
MFIKKKSSNFQHKSIIPVLKKINTVVYTSNNVEEVIKPVVEKKSKKKVSVENVEVEK